MALGRLVLVATLVLVPTLAHAGGPPGTIEPTAVERPAPTRSVRYGEQTFLADAAWVAGTLLLDHAGSEEAGSVGAVGYVVAPVAIHLAHHNGRGALRSVGLRMLLPSVGALGGMIAYRDGGEYAPLAGMVIGGGVGMLAAMVVDWTVLSKREVAAPRVAGVAIAPSVQLGPRSVGVSLGGSF